MKTNISAGQNFSDKLGLLCQVEDENAARQSP
jgi:hypothetical protein